MRNLTLKLMVWSATSIDDGVELKFAITGDVLQKKSVKLSSLWPPLDARLHPDDQQDLTHHLRHSTVSGVLSIDGAMVNAGGELRMLGTDIGMERARELAARH
jgi:hypothetical protein